MSPRLVMPRHSWMSNSFWEIHEIIKPIVVRDPQVWT